MVIQLLEFTPLLFSSMFKNGGLGTGTAGGGNRNHWGRVISVCMYTMALGLRLLGDSGLQVNFQIIVLERPNDVL